MILTFPNKTAKEIVDECDNKLGKGKFLYDIDWYKDEDFYTMEKCSPRTVEVIEEIQHLGKTWNECKAMEKSGKVEMLNFPEYLYFIQEYYKKYDKYFDSKWSWTSSHSSFGDLVRLGGGDAGGVRVLDGGPWGSRDYLGVVFSCSVAIPVAKGGQPEADYCDLEARVAKIEAWIRNNKDQLI